jgi:thymidylate kinase
VSGAPRRTDAVPELDGVAVDRDAQGSLSTDGRLRGEALPLVVHLCDALRDEAISYCHWKSNEALDRSASADNDLDLLVSRRDAPRFVALLHRLGFREAMPEPWKRLPGVFHFYGLDRHSGRLVHVHAQVQMVLGDDMTKNYRLPIEERYLAESDQGPLFRVPSAEVELAVFVIRMTLKHSTLDAIASGLGGLKGNEVREMEHLLGRSDPARLRTIVAEMLPFVGPDLWWRCLRSIRPGASLRSRVTSAQRLQRALDAHARRSRRFDTLVRMWRRGLVLARRVIRHRRRKELAIGGALIAVVGGDGAGKSTVVNELASWLSDAFVVTKVHLGKPPRSVVTRIGRGLWGIGSRRVATSSADGTSTVGGLSARNVWDLLNARDRYRAYARARRRATNGGLVVCDRYPIPQIFLMDGGRGRRLLEARDPLVRRFARLEQRYYEHIRSPDILLVLRVDPEVAVSRKRGEESETFIRPRADEVWRADWTGTPAIVVDANRPPEQVLADVKAFVWERL